MHDEKIKVHRCTKLNFGSSPLPLAEHSVCSLGFTDIYLYLASEYIYIIQDWIPILLLH
jgi:hypothetical protein